MLFNIVVKTVRMFNRPFARWIFTWVTLILFLGSTTSSLIVKRNALAKTSAIASIELQNNYLPFTWKKLPWDSPFGVELISLINSDSMVLKLANDIPSKWVRLNNRISWRQLQPNEGGPIQWGLLVAFENELRALRGSYITPIVVVDDYPYWATMERSPGVPSYCGPMRGDKFTAFANFMSQLVARYKVSEFNVHVWELGNEPDVDGLVYTLPIDSEYGCWGDADDLDYYGGQHYGEMLKVVTPVIKAADPLAQVWIGGLLLNSPNTTTPGHGHPEFFLKGILQAGRGTDYSYFDMVPFHTYNIYNGRTYDYDNGDVQSPWYALGGSVKGKATFLRQLMVPYVVQKPLFVNEISLTCPEEYFPQLCSPPVDAFLEMQANHLVRVQVRGLSEDIEGFTWYTLDGPGWRNGGLLDNFNNPRPSYLAYKQLAHQLYQADYLTSVDYGADFEAYAFQRDHQEIHVVWTKVDLSGLSIHVPVGSFIEARSRDGTLITPVLVDGSYQIPVGFAPVYVIRIP